ncbi:MAG TPA: hypothetical protein VGM77_04690 [Gemmatimonadales bacterium]|jgi:hypothetical protein
MNTRRLVALSIMALAAAPLALCGQDARITARFTPVVAAHLNATIDSASSEGLPAEPLVLRALEGQAKGATADQIVAALSRLRDALRTARVALGSTATPTDLMTAAAALQLGMPPSRLTELRQLRGDRGIGAPLTAYLDLTARGVSADRTWDRISDLARRRASDADFGRLTPRDVDHQRDEDWP